MDGRVLGRKREEGGGRSGGGWNDHACLLREILVVVMGVWNGGQRAMSKVFGKAREIRMHELKLH